MYGRETRSKLHFLHHHSVFLNTACRQHTQYLSIQTDSFNSRHWDVLSSLSHSPKWGKLIIKVKCEPEGFRYGLGGLLFQQLSSCRGVISSRTLMNLITGCQTSFCQGGSWVLCWWQQTLANEELCAGSDMMKRGSTRESHLNLEGGGMGGW